MLERYALADPCLGAAAARGDHVAPLVPIDKARSMPDIHLRRSANANYFRRLGLPGYAARGCQTRDRTPTRPESCLVRSHVGLTCAARCTQSEKEPAGCTNSEPARFLAGQPVYGRASHDSSGLITSLECKPPTDSTATPCPGTCIRRPPNAGPVEAADRGNGLFC
jgi:hypothetical protein